MNIDAEATHDLLVTIHNLVETPKVTGILATALKQLEDIIAESAPTMTVEEMALPTKMKKVLAYKERTNARLTTAHAVVNVTWRKCLALGNQRR